MAGSSSSSRRKVPTPAVAKDAPSLFFSLQRGMIYNPIHLSKVVSITIPLQHLRSRDALADVVTQRFLHKLYEMSAEERRTSASASQQENADKQDEDPHMVVGIDSVEPQPDTSHQANTLGDVRLNVLVSFTIARVRHGLLVGVASDNCPLAQCMTVSIAPCDASDTENISINVLRREDEPAVDGQSVIVVLQPGSIQYVAIRPPRVAPGPFRMFSDVKSDTVQVNCDIPPSSDDGAPATKKPRVSNQNH